MQDSCLVRTNYDTVSFHHCSLCSCYNVSERVQAGRAGGSVLLRWLSFLSADLSTKQRGYWAIPSGLAWQLATACQLGELKLSLQQAQPFSVNRAGSARESECFSQSSQAIYANKRAKDWMQLCGNRRWRFKCVWIEQRRKRKSELCQ